MDPYKRIKYNKNDYAVFTIRYRDDELPVLLDFDDFKLVHKMKKTWKCNNNGFVYYQQGGSYIYMHEIIMKLANKESSQNKPIIHINRIGLDNRRDNLVYDFANKDITKNNKKKKRTIDLPKKSGIKPDLIPTYIWYMKPDAW